MSGALQVCPSSKRIVLQEAANDRPLVMLGVNSVKDSKLSRRTAAEHEAKWPSLWDREKQLSNRWNVTGYPTTYVVNHQGKVVIKSDPARSASRP